MGPLAPLAAVGSAVGSALLLGSSPPTLPFLSFLQGEGKTDESAENVGVDFQKDLPALTDKLRQHLKAAGIATADPIHFSIGPSGSIEVGTQHPQWREIEALLNGSPELASELSHLLTAAEQSTDNLAPQGRLVLRAKDAELLVDDSPIAVSAAG